LERIYILLSEEKLLSSWQAACQALGLECAAAVAGENRKDDLQAALRSGADYILLPHQSYSPAEFAKAWAQRAECDCLSGTHGTGFSAWLSKMLLSYFTMRWLPSGAPAFVLIQADKLTPLLDCIPEKGPSAGAFLAAAAEYAGLSVKWVPCASGEAAGAAFTWFLLHIFTAYGSYLHVSEHMRALEASTEEKPDHGYHTAFDKLLGLVNHEIISYVFFGLLTTVVSMVSFYLFNELLGKDRFLGDKNYLIANALSWIAAVLFAFVTNKRFVFNSRSWKAAVVWKEFAGFLSARLFSLLVDMGLMYLFVSAMGMREMIAKFIVQIVIVIINYVFSKLFIFRKQKK
jgi:putative flippase GtrA